MRNKKVYWNGDIINKITFIKELPNDKRAKWNRYAKWECYCGKDFTAHINDVKRGKQKSCGCYKSKATSERVSKKYFNGQLINGIEFIREKQRIIYNNGISNRTGEFRCFCGNVFITIISLVKSKHTKSCGCLVGNYHGDSTQKSKHYYLFILFNNMKRRCLKKGLPQYKDYGGRGVTIYNKWLENYNIFKQYIINTLGERPTPSHSLDRIDNNGNYEPGNIRWATHLEQNNNSRAVKITIKERTQIKKMIMSKEYNIKEIASIYNVSSSTIRRIKKLTIL